MHNKIRTTALATPIAFLLSLSPVVSLAEQNPDNNNDPENNPVIVTATRTANSVDQVLATSTVIERKEILESQTLTVAYVLRTKAGIDVASNGGPGQTSSVFIRGAESDHTLIMIDGVKMNPGTIGVSAIQIGRAHV